MRRSLLAVALASLLAASPAAGQITPYPAGPTGQSSLALIAPTVASPTDSSNRIATTAWVNSMINAGLPLASGNIWIGSVGNIATAQTPSGDLTVSNAGVFTFGTVNANVGTFGSVTQCATVTVSAKGLVTAASQNVCTPAIANVTGLGTGIAAALGVNVGSAGAPVLFNGAGGTPSSLTGTNITGTAAGLTAGTASAVAIGGITGAGAGCITWLTTPSSANLRGCVNDETGTGLAYFQGGDIGTPSAGVITNLTGTCTTCVSSTFTQGNAGNLNNGTLAAARTNGHMNGTATNDNAAAGEVGEYIEATVASGSAVALTTSVAKTVTSLTLPTAGDWEVSGQVAFTSGATTSFTIVAGSLSLTTDTSSSTLGRWNQTVSAAFVPAGVPISTVIISSRFSVTGSTQVFLVAFATFTVSTAGGYGIIRARRVR